MMDKDMPVQTIVCNENSFHARDEFDLRLSLTSRNSRVLSS